VYRNVFVHDDDVACRGDDGVPIGEYFVNRDFFAKEHTEKDHIYREQLAQNLIQHNMMPGKLRLSEIKAVLQTLEHTSIQVFLNHIGTDNTKQGNNNRNSRKMAIGSNHCAIMYRGRDLFVAVALLENNTHDKLGTAIKSVLNYDITQKMTCMFGFDSLRRHKPTVIHLGPDPARHLTVGTGNVTTPESIRMLQGTFRVHEDADQSDSIIAQAFGPGDELKVHDEPLEKKVYTKHCEERGISNEWRVENTSSTSEPEYSRQRIHRQGSRRLPSVNAFLAS
jgi:hypothetical protein